MWDFSLPFFLSFNFPMHLLLGGHTIGSAACHTFSFRFHNFNRTSPVNPSIDPAYVPQLQAECSSNGGERNRVGLDTGRTGRFETSFFNNLRIGREVLLSDQLLWEDASTRHFVRRLLGARGSPPLNFHVEFGRSMVKTSNIGVKTGFAGEIRRVCSSVN